MRLIFTTLVFFIYLLNSKAQIRFEDPYMYATGRYIFHLGGRNNLIFEQNTASPIYIAPHKKISYQSWANNIWQPSDQTILNYLNDNCALLKSVNYFLGSKESIRDSFLIVNGKRKEYMLYQINTMGELIERMHQRYFYNTHSKLDSAFVLGDSLVKIVYSYIYDSQNRQISLTTTGVSATERTIFVRNICQYDDNGEISYFKEEDYIDNRWKNSQEWFLKWSSGKLLTFKNIDYFNNPIDTQRLTFNYIGASNIIQNIVYEIHQASTNTWNAQKRYLNVSQNAKGYPTQIDYQSSPNNGVDWGTYERYTFKYYPNDTLLFQRINISLIPTIPINRFRETFEYCGIAPITSVNDIENIDFSIYPNPTNQVLNIQLTQNTEEVVVEIFNTMGILVSKSNQLEIDISNLNEGIYFAQVKQKYKVGIKRFLILR